MFWFDLLLYTVYRRLFTLLHKHTHTHAFDSCCFFSLAVQFNEHANASIGIAVDWIMDMFAMWACGLRGEEKSSWVKSPLLKQSINKQLTVESEETGQILQKISSRHTATDYLSLFRKIRKIEIAKCTTNDNDNNDGKEKKRMTIVLECVFQSLAACYNRNEPECGLKTQ